MNIERVYFIGIGGIGMSNLARYYRHENLPVAGYDRTPSDLTLALEKEGVSIHYEESAELIPEAFRDPETTLVVRTPAVPMEHPELVYFSQNGFTVMKRAEVLGLISKDKRALCVSGTHGKTTTSTLLAHLLRQSSVDCNAFLGGISKNYQTNLLLSEKSDLAVIEADEFDRSFHHLRPYMAVVTATDADHLDIYGTPENYVEAFRQFASLVDPDGFLVVKQGLALFDDNHPSPAAPQHNYTAHGIEADFYPWNVRHYGSNIFFDLRTPGGVIYDLELPCASLYNVENAVAAAAICISLGVNEHQLRYGFKTYTGVKRRFDYHINTPQLVFIDDYAHHPQEIEACLDSIRYLYPDKRIVGIFQPHLYSRTRDFADEFARALSTLDELIMLPIYPAREKPILGVTSSMVMHKINSMSKYLCTFDQAVELLPALCPDVVVTMGAGSIDRLVPRLVEKMLEEL